MSSSEGALSHPTGVLTRRGIWTRTERITKGVCAKRRGRVRTQRELAVRKPKRPASGGMAPSDALILDFQPSELFSSGQVRIQEKGDKLQLLFPVNSGYWIRESEVPRGGIGKRSATARGSAPGRPGAQARAEGVDAGHLCLSPASLDPGRATRVGARARRSRRAPALPGEARGEGGPAWKPEVSGGAVGPLPREPRQVPARAGRDRYCFWARSPRLARAGTRGCGERAAAGRRRRIRFSGVSLTPAAAPGARAPRPSAALGGGGWDRRHGRLGGSRDWSGGGPRTEPRGCRRRRCALARARVCAPGAPAPHPRCLRSPPPSRSCVEPESAAGGGAWNLETDPPPTRPGSTRARNVLTLPALCSPPLSAPLQEGGAPESPLPREGPRGPGRAEQWRRRPREPSL
ncbi:homeobox protein unc-4 homolog [Meles meles]|uniref:homeobox protein unc-4 homolog n=1 Tax=Meles meles TaxID=9662 RepID=UPI001E69A5C2|nr:homeobox protein unc-4 homolog [Meles meles]